MNIKGISLGAVAVLSASALFSTGVALASTTTGQGGASQATFTIAANDDDNAELSLTSVPDFDFGTVNSTDIYHGFTGHIAQGTPASVTVEDSRMANSGWTLNVSRTAFTGLSGSVLHLGSGVATLGSTQVSGDVDETNPTTLGANQGTGYHGTFEMAMAAADNNLDLAANPTANITSGALTSDLTWTLSGDDLTGDALQ